MTIPRLYHKGWAIALVIGKTAFEGYTYWDFESGARVADLVIELAHNIVPPFFFAAERRQFYSKTAPNFLRRIFAAARRQFSYI